MNKPIGPPAHLQLGPEVKARTSELLAACQDNKSWRVPAQRAIAAVIFWMQDNNVSKRDLAKKMGNITEQAMGQMLKLGADFKLSTIGRLSDATGLDLFAVMAVTQRNGSPQTVVGNGTKSEINIVMANAISPSAMIIGRQKVLNIFQSLHLTETTLENHYYGAAASKKHFA